MFENCARQNTCKIVTKPWWVSRTRCGHRILASAGDYVREHGNGGASWSRIDLIYIV